MASPSESVSESVSSLAVSSSSTIVPPSLKHFAAFDLPQKQNRRVQSDDVETQNNQLGQEVIDKTSFEKLFNAASNRTYTKMAPVSRRSIKQRLGALFSKSGKLRPFRLLREDIRNIRKRYVSDWTLFNQLVFASAVYVFFTNLLPGITFASDLHVLTGMTWGTIEVVFSTGLCGIIFAF